MVVLKKVLETVAPPITSFPSHTSLLSVIFGKKEWQNWFYSNFIQLICMDASSRRCSLDFFPQNSLESCPVIEKYHIPRDYIYKHHRDDLEQYFMQLIDLGYYLFGTFDEFFIDHSYAYEKYSFPHTNMFVVGYDTDNRTFVHGGFFNQRRYAYYETGFDHFKKSFLEMNLEDELFHHPHRYNGLFIFKPNPYAEYDFDANLAKSLMEDYVHSRNTSEKLRLYGKNNRYIYGLDCYEVIKVYIRRQSDSERGGLLFDTVVRALHVLKDHKTSLKYTINHLYKTDHIANPNYLVEMEQIERDAMILLSHYIKYQCARNRESMESVFARIDRLKEKEGRYLSRLLEEL